MDVDALSGDLFQFATKDDQIPPDRGKLSFKDIMFPTRVRPPSMPKRNLLKDKIAKITYLNDYRLLTNFELDGSYLKELSKPWADGVVLKLLRKKVSFFSMQ